MNIFEKVSEKIEQVRCQPEHVRMRYVWGSVAISMCFIVAIWIFSMGSLFQGDKKEASQDAAAGVSITEQLQNLKQQAPSIKDFSGTAFNVENEGLVSAQNANESVVAAEKVDAPKADTYSDLSEAVQGQ